jgi:hypothetical protein
MPTNIAAGYRAPSAGARHTAYDFPRFGTAKLALAIWAIAVLLIGTIASFETGPEFLGDFDVSVAAF